MTAVLFQLLVLGNFVSVDELEGAARTLHEEFHRLTETEVTQKIKDKTHKRLCRLQLLILRYGI